VIGHVTKPLLPHLLDVRAAEHVKVLGGQVAWPSCQISAPPERQHQPALQKQHDAAEHGHDEHQSVLTSRLPQQPWHSAAFKPALPLQPGNHTGQFYSTWHGSAQLRSSANDALIHNAACLQGCSLFGGVNCHLTLLAHLSSTACLPCEAPPATLMPPGAHWPLRPQHTPT